MQLCTVGVAKSFIFVLLFFYGFASDSEGPICACGYYDDRTQYLFTESVIVYFNETAALPLADFEVESYTHRFEKGWNTQYREGAAASNAMIAEVSSANGSRALELRVRPFQEDHLVMGASLRSIRRDIEYGSFRSLMRSPAPWVGGSALSMGLQYNLTQTITLNLQNADEPSAASVSMIEGEEFPDATLGMSYANMTTGRFGNGTISPWDYTEYRIDWTREAIKFYIGGHVARTISRHDKQGLLSTPSPLFLRHRSNGNKYASQGPPEQPSSAHVAWVRMFFNSSLMTGNDHARFDEQCNISKACSADDTTLRASSVYPQSATLEWQQAPTTRPKRWVSIWIAVCCITVTTSVLVGPIWKRVQEKFILNNGMSSRPSARNGDKSHLIGVRSTVAHKGFLLGRPRPPSPCLTGDKKHRLTVINKTTPRASHGSSFNLGGNELISEKRTVSDEKRCDDRKSGGKDTTESNDKTSHNETCSGDDLMLRSPTRPSSTQKSNTSVPKDHNWRESNSTISVRASAEGYNWRDSNAIISVRELEDDAKSEVIEDERRPRSKGLRLSNRLSNRLSSRLSAHGNAVQTAGPVIYQPPIEDKSVQTKSLEALPSLPKGQQQIEHLAGLVTFSALLVTVINFTLTFVPGVVDPAAFTHYRSETIARRTVSSFLLNLIWIGPFLMTSTRFLISDYLRNGDYLSVADKSVRRI